MHETGSARKGERYHSPGIKTGEIEFCPSLLQAVRTTYGVADPEIIKLCYSSEPVLNTRSVCSTALTPESAVTQEIQWLYLGDFLLVVMLWVIVGVYCVVIVNKYHEGSSERKYPNHPQASTGGPRAPHSLWSHVHRPLRPVARDTYRTGGCCYQRQQMWSVLRGGGRLLSGYTAGGDSLAIAGATRDSMLRTRSVCSTTLLTESR